MEIIDLLKFIEQELLHIKLHYAIWEKLNKKIIEMNGVTQKVPVFLSIFYSSIQYSFFLRLANLLENRKRNESANIKYLLDLITKNLDLFNNTEYIQNLKNSISHDLFDKDGQEYFVSDNIVAWRDKSIAHNDFGYYQDRTKIISDYGLLNIHIVGIINYLENMILDIAGMLIQSLEINTKLVYDASEIDDFFMSL